MFKKLFYTGLALVLVFSCREDDEVVNTPPVAVDSTLTVDLSGYVQKGPFINGTAITISELDKKLVTTGKNFTTQIADNKGSFSLKGIKLKSNFVQLQADGFYFDEVKGEKSAAQLTLFALSDVEDVSSINANLLSHMERSRVIYLMQEEEKSFAEAKQQAQQEILEVFGIEKEEMQQSELLDISQDGEDNAILLAISAVLQANNTVAELSELVANLITDLREDGVLSSQSNQAKIKEQGKVLNLPQIRLNLEKRYEELGVEASIPNFEQYIDSDGDGILNKDEDDNPDDFMFTLQKDVAVSIATTSNPVKISGLKEGGTANAVVRNGQIVLNGKVSADTAVQVKNGDALQLQLTSSQAYADTVKATVSIGTVVKHFQVITDDYQPDAFSFTAQKDVAVDSLYTSNTITVSGIPFATPLKIEGGILIKNGEELTTDTTSVKNGDKLAVRLLSSQEYKAITSATVDINGMVGSFSLTTDDYKPDEFTFTAIEDAERNTIYLSEHITVRGLRYHAIVIINEGELIKNGESVDQDTIYVSNGDQLQIKLQSPLGWNENITVELQLGSYKTSFAISTLSYPWATTVSGYLQVGPFSNGANFTLTEIDSNFVKTSTSFTTQTTNGQGYYSRNDIQLNYPWTIAEVKGYYYDFINKKTSEGELTLTAYTDLSTTAKLNVNVLTHLEAPRVKYLVSSGLSFTEAKQQALREVLSVFEIDEPISTLSEHFDIAQKNPEGAILLAISSILQGYESTGTLQELLRNISEDLETDGTLDNPILGSAVINNAFYLDLAIIRTAVNAKYKELGKTITVGDFEQYIKAFKENTNFTLTKKISYPTDSKYGENLLGVTKNSFQKNIYGICADLPTHSKLKIRFTSQNPEGEPPHYGISSYEEWVIEENNYNSLLIKTAQSGKIEFRIQIFGNFKIEVFENEASMPTHTINIVAY